MDRFEVAYTEEVRAFVQVARGAIRSPCTAQDALEAMRISVAATQSLANGRPVCLADVS